MLEKQLKHVFNYIILMQFGIIANHFTETTVCFFFVENIKCLLGNICYF